MSTYVQDLRYGLRMVAKNPGFTASVALTVAVGIAAATTIFSLVNFFFLRPLPGVVTERLVNVHATEPGGGSFLGFSYPFYQDVRDGNEAFECLAAFRDHGFSLRTGEGHAELVGGMLVSGNYFSALGVRPGLGRFFLPEEDRTPGRHAVAVVSHGLWKRRFGGDASLVGKEIHLNGHPFTVVGVAPEGFYGNFIGFPFQIWVPLMMAPRVAPEEDLDARDGERLELVGRRKPEVSLEQARAAMTSLAGRLRREHPGEWRQRGFHLQPATGLEDSLRGGILGFLGVLSAVAVLLLMISCVNVGGMLLARGVSRQRELAIRLALGSGRGSIVRQLLFENLLLFVLGGTAGTLLAYGCADLLLRFNPPFAMPLLLDIAPDRRVLAFALALTLLAGVAFGLLAAIQTSRPDLLQALKGEASGRGVRGSRIRGGFVIGQVAMSLLLLVIAGLFLRTVRQASNADPGFEREGLFVTDVSVGLLGYDKVREQELSLHLLERVVALPGVTAATVAQRLPLGLGSSTTRVNVDGKAPPRGETDFTVEANTVGDRYFETMRIPIRSGRAFGASDRADSIPVAIVNEEFARRFWPGSDPLGKEIVREGGRLRVIGVARNGKYRRLWEHPRAHVYTPASQDVGPSRKLILRISGSPDAALASLPGELRRLDPNLPVTRAISAAQHIGISLTPQRIAATVAAVLGLVGLLLAGIGVYGLIAFSVSQRTREIGIRTALGARRSDVLAIVLRQGALLAAAGLAIGTLLALFATRLLSSMLYGVRPHDPATFGAVALLLMVVALLASYVPARRAARVDPMIALRRE